MCKRVITSCIIIASLLLQSAIAQDAHSNFLYYVYADNKEKVTVTCDDKKIYKFWSLEDGKHLFTFKEDDADMNVKMLIYNIQKEEWQERNIEDKLYFRGNYTIQYVLVDGRKILEKEYATLDPSFIAVHYKTTRVADKVTKNGYSTISLLTENKADINNPHVETLATIKDPTLRIYDIKFSPSGRYIFSSGGCMIDIDNKKLLWNEEDWKNKYNFSGYNFTFNKDETKLGCVNKNYLIILNVQTGAVEDSIPLPEQFKKYESVSIFPCADMKSFVVTLPCYSSKKDDCSKKAWLVKKDTVIELVD